MSKLTEVLSKHFPILNEVDETILDQVVVYACTNRDGDLSMMTSVNVKLLPELFATFDVVVSEKLQSVVDEIIRNVIVDLDSLKTNQIRLYSNTGVESILNVLGVELPDESTEERPLYFLGILYDIAEDKIVEYKMYYGTSTATSLDLVQCKYNENLEKVSEYAEVSEGEFSDMTGLVEDLKAIDAPFVVTNRTEIPRSYLMIRPKNVLTS